MRRRRRGSAEPPFEVSELLARAELESGASGAGFSALTGFSLRMVRMTEPRATRAITHGSCERRNFLAGQMPPIAFCQSAEVQRADGQAHQPEHADAQRLEQPAEVTVLPFVKDR